LEIYRTLAKTNPDAYLSRVAMILHNIGIFYSNSNAYKKAQNTYKEALKIRRTLAKTNPDAYSIDLASTLIIGVDLFKQPVAQLSEAKNLLHDFAHIPKASS
jgi:tetratricopeptide (TPR) repeat protein